MRICVIRGLKVFHVIRGKKIIDEICGENEKENKPLISLISTNKKY